MPGAASGARTCETRNNVAAVDATTGVVTSWNPNSNGTVRAIAVRCGDVLVGGFFTVVGSQTRNRLALIDGTTALPRAWNPDSNGPVFSLTPGGGRVYVGGIFGAVGGQSRNRVASLDPVSGAASSWDPNSGGTVRAISVTPTDVVAGGGYATMGGLLRSNLASIQADASTPCPAVTLGPATLPAGTTGVAYSQTVTASGGSGPYCFALTAGQLPVGLVLDGAAGTLTGTPGAAGSYAFTLTATNAAGCTGSQAYAVTVGCPAIAIAPASLPNGTTGAPYSQTLSASGGSAPYVFAVIDGTLPAGLTLGAGGALGGTPAARSAASFTVRAADAYGCAATRLYTLTVFDPGVSAHVAPSPAGLCISPAQPCVSVPFTITRTDTVPVRALSVTFRIDTTLVSLCTPGAPAASVHPGAWSAGFPNSTLQVVSRGGGVFTVDQSLLGDSCGVTGAGQVFTVDLKSVAGDGHARLEVTAATLRDCSNLPLTVAPGAADSLPIQNAPLAILPLALPGGATTVAYAETLTTANGTGPYGYAVSGGALPGGITLAASGVLAGIPTSAGTATFTVTVTDGFGCTGTREYAIVVSCTPIVIAPATLPDATVGTPYHQGPSAAPVAAPLAWTLADGSLPDGVTLDGGTGALDGVPTTAGTTSFTLAAAAGGCSAVRPYTLTVFATPAADTVAAATAGVCITTSAPCAAVPFVVTRADTTPVRALSVTFQLDVARLALCTPASPAASIHPGPWSSGFPNRVFQVVDNGGGSYTVDQAILGAPCGITGAGTLFTVDLHAVAGDGSGAITVTAAHARDCDNVPLAIACGGAAALTIDLAGPTPIADLAAAQVVAGNAPGDTTGIVVNWTQAAGDTVRLYRAPFGSYPLYDAAGPVSPPDPALAPGAPWTLVSATATPGYVDHPPARGFWFYVAWVTDACARPRRPRTAAMARSTTISAMSPTASRPATATTA